jgi:eukaryotic-like serine/threonine-protein kinase
MADETTVAVSSAASAKTALDDGRAERQAGDSTSAGRPIGRYVISRRIGRGGMGTVYEAFDPKLERRVAVKVLRRSAIRDLGKSSTTRMLREAQCLARLSHPNVVPVYDVGVADGRIWVAMEYVEGGTLRQWLEQPRSWREVVEVFVAAGRGLVAVHEVGLVHRDFKPSNVLVGDDRRVRVTDLGLARTQADGSVDVSLHRERDGFSTETRTIDLLDLSITNPGDTMGTPAYMAPEQHTGDQADAHADQFAFCVSLYEALWSRRPFSGKTLKELERAKTRCELPTPERSIAVPRRLWPVVRRGLSPNPLERWPSMHVLLVELEQVLRPPRRKAWLATGGLCLLAGAAWIARPPSASDCRHGRDRLEEVWNDGRRASIRAAIAQAGVPYGARTTMVVERSLDHRTRRLASAYDDACRNPEPESRLSSARLACLDDALHQLDAWISVLESGEHFAVERAVLSVDELRTTEACFDSDASLAAAYWTPRLKDRDAQSLRQRLRHVNALARSGNVTEAVARAEEALARARELDHSPVLVEALVELGQAKGSAGQIDDAEAALQEAVLLGESIGYDELAAQAAIELTLLLASTRTRLDAAQWWSRRAEAAVERLGGPRMLRARLFEALGLLAREKGDPTASYERFATSLELTRSMERARSHRVARALARLSSAAADLSRLAEARSLNEEAYALMVEDVGDLHPSVGWTVLESARLAARAGDFPTALERHSTARTIFESSLGPDSTDALYAADEEASLLTFAGRPEEALELHRRALAGLEEKLGPDHPNLAVTYRNLGTCLDRLGHPEDSLAAYRRSHEINERALGTEHVATGFSHHMLGLAMERLDRDEEAREHYLRAAQIRLDVLGSEHPDVAYSIANLGLLDRKAGDLEAAREGLRFAVERLDVPEEPDPLALAALLVDLAELELELASREAALASAERALELFPPSETHASQAARAREVILALDPSRNPS